LSIAKETPPSTNRTSFVVSCSDLDRDETLAIILAKLSTRQLNCSTKTLNPKLLSSNAKEVIIPRGLEVRKSVVKEPFKANNKRIMQPFAMSLNKKQMSKKKTFDVCQPLSKNKMKPVHSNEESTGIAILTVKKEWKNNKPRRSITTRQE